MKEWTLKESQSVSSQDISTTPVVFDNLLGDSYDYRIYVTIDSDATNYTQINWRLNSDSGTNYRNYQMNGIGATPSATVGESDTQIAGLFTHQVGTYRNAQILEITGSSGDERCITSFRSSTYNSATYLTQIQSYWKNTSDEVTSLTAVGSNTNAVTAEIYLFQRPKSGVYNAEDFEIVERVEFTSRNLNTDPIDFLVQGDDEEYLFDIDITDTSSNYIISCIINDDTTSSNYTYQALRNNGGTLSSATGSAYPFNLNVNEGNNHKILIKAKTGQYRPMLSTSGQYSATYVEQWNAGWWWNNTADIINKLTIRGEASATSTGVITLYKRTKFKSSINAHEKLIEEYDIEENATKLLLHMDDADLTDSSLSAHTITKNGDVTRSASQSKFGGYSAYFDGTGDYLTTDTSSDFNVGSVDFTADFWVRTSDNTVVLVHSGASGGASNTNWVISLESNTAKFAVSNGSSYFISISASTIINDNNWHHVAVSKSGTTYRIFVDGTQENTVTNSGTMNTSTYQIHVGDNSSGAAVTGYIDEFRFIKGKAVWTSNFTPETKAYTGNEDKIAVDFSSGYTFKNLPTEENCIYRCRITTQADSTDEIINIAYNSDTGSNYVYQSLYGTGSTTTASTGTTTSLGYPIDTAYPTNIDFYIFPATGKYRPTLLKSQHNQSSANYIFLNSTWWLNTADKLQNIKYFTTGSNAITGSIQLYKIPLTS